MRAADRDRCRRAVAALGIVLVIACTPACALSAAYAVAGNGTAYLAHLEVHDADGYSFVETGILGERIPIPVSGVLVTNETGAVAFEEQGRTGITFPRGDYTITFAGTVRDSYLQAMYDRPYNVTVTIPPPYDVRNPLLGMISPGGTVTDGDGALTIRWEQVRGFECRFYDPFREQLLVIFGTFWLALCAVFLVPFLLVRRRNRD